MMPDDELRNIQKQEDVQQALQQMGRSQSATFSKRDWAWFVFYGLGLLVLGGLHYWLQVLPDVSAAPYADLLKRLPQGLGFILILLAFARLANTVLLGRVKDDATRYNLKRVLHLVLALMLMLVFLSLIFTNWYTALASLGLISLILGFAFQTSIASLIGWVYLLIRQPYRVGDRIKVGEAAGDVIDVGYLDTTLWEFGGQYLSTDHPSGRIIQVPNSMVLNTPVYNYSWALFPYIWNEIKFNVAYGSDLQFVASVMEEVATEALGESMMQQVTTFRTLLAQTPVDEVEVKEKPVVLFRVSENTWVEAIVRYLVHPKKAGPAKTAMIQTMLARLNAEPGRVMFPRGDMR